MDAFQAFEDPTCASTPSAVEQVIPISSLEQESIATQRARLAEDQILWYVDHPETAEPVLVYENDGERVLVNGHHRVAAAVRRGETEILAEIQLGKSRQDALRYRDLRGRPW